jgi:hypothetical protein
MSFATSILSAIYRFDKQLLAATDPGPELVLFDKVYFLGELDREVERIREAARGEPRRAGSRIAEDC